MDATSAPLLMHPTLPIQSEESVDQGLLLNQHQDSALKRAWRPFLREVAKEIEQLYAIALPMIITGLLVYGKSVISMLFLGKIGKSALAGGSLSMGIANITGYSVISGLSMGMDAISSQAHGAHRFSLMSQNLHRTIAILLTATIPITILWLNAKPLLVFAQQDPAISGIVATYLVLTIPSLVFQCFINPLKIYLRAKNVTSPLLVAATFALTFHAAINHLVLWLGHGFRGVAVAVAVTDFVPLSSLLLYLHSSSDVSWWWYELMIILSGLIPNPAEAISTMGILLQATSLIYIFPSALSLAVSARVGNELGANRPRKARLASWIAFSCAVVTSFIAMAFTIASRKAWGRAFTADTAIISLTATVMPVVGLCELGNCPQTTSCGVLRGCARPTLGAYINLGSFYGIGLPLAGLMGFVIGMGLLGLWLGLMVAQLVCWVLMVVFLWRTDWEKEADRAQELIRDETIVE